MKRKTKIFAVTLISSLFVMKMAMADTFTGVTIQNFGPILLFDDLTASDADWRICVDSTSGCAADQDFSINWFDLSPASSGSPFSIENGTPTNLLFLQNSGRIGVNTSVPAFTVDAIGDRIRLRNSTAGTANTIMMRADGSEADLQSENAHLFLHSPLHNVIINPFPGEGFVGIGTTAPIELVDVQQGGGAARFQLTSFTSTASEAAQFVQRRALGTEAAPLAVTAFQNLGLISFRGYNGVEFLGSKAAITGQTTENWTTTANGTRMLFQTTQNGSTTLNTVMEITQDRKVKINGITLNVPDYVFEDDYPLMPLKELKAYVKKEKHLPKVASANQVSKDGMIDLGGIQMTLLEKIEELTLYTIQQHEQIKEQQAELAQLREQNNALRAAFETRLIALEQQVAGRNVVAASATQ